jgi:hypothetical protein
MFYFLSCPVTDQQPKNVLPISVATRNFLYICKLQFTQNSRPIHVCALIETLCKQSGQILLIWTLPLQNDNYGQKALHPLIFSQLVY